MVDAPKNVDYLSWFSWLTRESRPQSKLDRWVAAGCPPPAPPEVKRQVLKRHGSHSGTWVETGTLFGDTAAFLSELGALHVYSVEPSPQFFDRARDRFSTNDGVTIIHGLAEDALPDVLKGIVGDVSFWLDGHYSGGETFQGDQDTPIREELAAITARLPLFNRVTIFVDDFRCFGTSEFPSYPSKRWLVEWAVENSLDWTVEHDIFVIGNDL
jgi:hypothetical protein